MAFKKPNSKSAVPDSPDRLFIDLPGFVAQRFEMQSAPN